MKKLIFSALITLILGGVIFLGSPSATYAQRYSRRVARNGRVVYVPFRKPSFYRRHRNASNIAIGTGAGAVIGGLIGGTKGALVGAGVGAGGSALYTYKWNPKKRRYIKIRKY